MGFKTIDSSDNKKIDLTFQGILDIVVQTEIPLRYGARLFKRYQQIDIAVSRSDSTSR